MSDRTEVFVVDRVEGAVVVLVPDQGETRQVRRSDLPEGMGEGAVLRVPLDGSGAPMWAQAQRDRALEEDLLAEGRRRLEDLKKRDPGGDITL